MPIFLQCLINTFTTFVNTNGALANPQTSTELKVSGHNFHRPREAEIFFLVLIQNIGMMLARLDVHLKEKVTFVEHVFFSFLMVRMSSYLNWGTEIKLFK